MFCKIDVHAVSLARLLLCAAGRARGQAAALKHLGLESDDEEPQGLPDKGTHSPKAATEKDRDVGEDAGIDRAAGQPASLLDELMSLPSAEPAADTLPAGELDA
jgi:hypothetical protein